MGGTRKFGGAVESRNNRRVLGVINHNLNPYPCVVNKRGLSDANGICDKNLPTPAHRSITRKFAAQIASSNQHCSFEENKKAKIGAEEFSVWEDIPLTDVEENEEAAKDQPVPMTMEQTETVLSNDKNQMEVEMEDIFEETIIDIDGEDAKNPLAVVEYVDGLFAHYRIMEGSCSVSPNYMAQHFDINERMRAILIDWLIEDTKSHTVKRSEEDNSVVVEGLVGQRAPNEDVSRDVKRQKKSIYGLSMSLQGHAHIQQSDTSPEIIVNFDRNLTCRLSNPSLVTQPKAFQYDQRKINIGKIIFNPFQFMLYDSGHDGQIVFPCVCPLCIFGGSIDSTTVYASCGVLCNCENYSKF